MEWRDQGLVLGGRRHGETSLILEVMTRTRGRQLGLVKGGRSKRLQPLLQPGNSVDVTWRARLEEHLGTFAVETTHLRAGEAMACPIRLRILGTVTALLRLLAEREPHDVLFLLAEELIDAPAGDDTLAGLVRFEAVLLAETGFGLDLDRCAATGQRDDLVYVSPRTGRAVSRGAGLPYADRLLPLPAFLVDDEAAAPGRRDILDGLALTGRFIERDLFAPRNLPMPIAREALVVALQAPTRSGSTSNDTLSGASSPVSAAEAAR